MAYDRYGRDRHSGRGYGRYNRPPEDYDDDDRGFFDRAGDEVRSWFGDEEAERRRRWDARQDERDYYGSSPRSGRDDDQRPRGYGAQGGSSYGYGPYGQRGENYGSHSAPRQGLGGSSYSSMREDYGARGAGRFSSRGDRSSESGYSRSGRSSGSDDLHGDYRDWRQRQMEVFDRDYDDYRRERQGRFDSEFGSWRQQRTSQRQHLAQVREHMDVVGSDGQHVGQVDSVMGDRVKLTKGDQEAGGRHHYVPCSWIQSIEGDSVKLNRTAQQTQTTWESEDDSGSEAW